MAAAPLPPVAASIPAPDSAPLSEGARVINTFIAPSKTFSDLHRNANWWAPWLLISIFALLFVYAMDRQVTFDQITRNEIARSPRADQFDKLPAEQQAKSRPKKPAHGRSFRLLTICGSNQPPGCSGAYE